MFCVWTNEIFIKISLDDNVGTVKGDVGVWSPLNLLTSIVVQTTIFVWLACVM